MAKIDIMKIKAELASVVAGKLNLEVSIQQALDDIERLKSHVKIQEDKEKELNEKLKSLSST